MRPAPLPPELRHRAFDLAAARRLGVPDGRLRRLDLVRPTRGLRWHADEPPTNIDRILAHRPLLRAGQFFSHVSAAVLWGLPLPWRLQQAEVVHVTSITPRNAMSRRGVVGHTMRAWLVDVRARRGVPTSSPATTWVECGGLLTVDELVALGDAIVTMRACTTTVDDLRAALALRPGCRGARHLAVALDLVRVGPGSAKETEGRLRIVRGGLPEPELQVEILDANGVFAGRVDMAYPEQRLIIEYEGDHHRTDPEQWAVDIQRYRRFDGLGWSTFRMTRFDLGPEATLDELAGRLGVARRTPAQVRAG